MLATRTASITELRDNLATWLDLLDQFGTVMILRHSKPAAYLVSPILFEALLERLEEVEDLRAMEAAVEDYRQGQAVPGEDVFARLGL